MKLLCISNGHGEDVIAEKILKQLQNHSHALDIVALPLVGEGHSYSQLAIPLMGVARQMPSGGFIYLDGKQLWRDLKGGLLQLTWQQYQLMRQWSQGENQGIILAVGDILPLIFAWLSGVDYVFVGTAKSEYYLRDESGWLPNISWLERFFGSFYYPWERWLMSRRRCRAVFVRDTLTKNILEKLSISALDLGNPMMDGIDTEKKFVSDSQETNACLTVLLLPGSREPEAIENWQIIIEAVTEIIATFPQDSLLFLAAIAPNLTLTKFRDYLNSQNWNYLDLNVIKLPINDGAALAFSKDNATLILTQNTYHQCLLQSQVAIAMAGTATEQFVGLGKPAFTIPGKGPQFNLTFAQLQTRLLGESVILVQEPQEVATKMQKLLQNSEQLESIRKNGQQRLGKAGGSQRIAQYLAENILC